MVSESQYNFFGRGAEYMHGSKELSIEGGGGEILSIVQKPNFVTLRYYILQVLLKNCVICTLRMNVLKIICGLYTLI